MDRKNTKKSVVERSKSQKGKKKLEVSTSRSRRTNDTKRVKAEDIPDSSDSSSFVETDEDYAEFLKTYNPMFLRSRTLMNLALEKKKDPVLPWSRRRTRPIL
jgi:hypothetical protein